MFITLLEEMSERSGHCNEIRSWKFYEGRRVSGVYQKLLKSAESIGILTSNPRADIDKINGDNPK